MAIKDKEKDRQHCIAIVHEYYRCKESFKLFTSTAEILIIKGHTIELGYRAYNAYSYLILHLFGFLISLFLRDLGVINEDKLKEKYKLNSKECAEFIDSLMHNATRKIIDNRIDDIKNGRAPSHWNAVESYEQLLPVPNDFPKEFRKLRNKLCPHVAYERAIKINLTEFYRKYHPYIFLLFVDNGYFWGGQNDQIPDLGLVTDFMKSISDEIHDIK